MQTDTASTSRSQPAVFWRGRSGRPQRRHAAVYLVPGFPVDDLDSTCLPAIQNHVHAYAEARPDVSVNVVALHYPFRRGTYAWNGVTVHALAGSNRRGWSRGARWLATLRILTRLASEAKIVQLHSFWLGECALMGSMAASLIGVPHVASIGGRDALEDNRYLRWLPLKGMTVTAGSEFAAERYRRSTGHRVAAVIPLGLDAAFLSDAPCAAVRDIDILGVGSLIQLKRWDLFVDAVGQVISSRPGLRAIIAGDGPERLQLRERIAGAGLDRVIRLVGAVDRIEVQHLMRRSRVLLHPSEYESQGYVFLEALASGMRVVARPVGYVHDIVHHGSMSDGSISAFQTDADLLPCLSAALTGDTLGPREVPMAADTVRLFNAIIDQS